MQPQYHSGRFFFFISLTLLLAACDRLESSSVAIAPKKQTVIYSVQAPNGKIYEVEGPPNASDVQIISFLKSIIEPNTSTMNPPAMVDLTVNGEPVPCSVHPNLLKDIFPNRISISCP